MLTTTSLFGAEGLYARLTNDKSAQNLAWGLGVGNSAYRQLCAQRPWYWLEKTDSSVETVAGQQSYRLPYDCERINDLYVTVNSYKYVPREVVDQAEWDRINGQVSYEGNVPVFFHVFGGELQLYPTPSVSGQAVTYNYRRRVVDLSLQDATGTAINAAPGVLARQTGDSFTSSMVGLSVTVPLSLVPATSGDGMWWPILSVLDAGTLTVASAAFTGRSFTDGPFTIGQLPALPEAFQDLPAYMAAKDYYTFRNPDLARAKAAADACDAKYAGLVRDSKETSDVRLIVEADRLPLQNPNSFVWLP